MKKIMFSDKFNLTEAVLSGRKTMTRRIAPKDTPLGCWEETEAKAHFKVGEIVAIAQSYKDAGVLFIPEEDDEFGCYDFPAEQTNGWTNKMFVRADLMPHQIRITNVRVELLQDISDEDCVREGVVYREDSPFLTYGVMGCAGMICLGNSPREAFATLIDKVSGKGVWNSNPFVFAYDFELVK